MSNNQALMAFTSNSFVVENDKAQQIRQSLTLSPSDIAGVLQFGSSTQQKASVFADTMLAEVKNKDLDQVGEVLGSLMLKCKSIDPKELTGNKGFLSNIPFVGRLLKQGQAFLVKYETIVSEIQTIVTKLESSRQQLVQDVESLTQVYQNNFETFKELEVYIAVGREKLQELATIIQEKRNNSDDSLEAAQELQDYIQLENRLEKRLHDLELTKMIAIQTAPQIKLIQDSNLQLAEKIQSSIVNTIPLWKQQIVIAVALMRQKSAVELQQAVSDTTNELLLKNSELLKQNVLATAKESERGVVDVQTLTKVNTELVQTMNELQTIRQQGKQGRIQAQVELISLQKQLQRELQR